MNYQDTADSAHKLLETIKNLRGDIMSHIIKNTDGSEITSINYPNLEEVSNALIHLILNSERFINQVLMLIIEIREKEELKKQTMIHYHNIQIALKRIQVLKNLKPMRTNTASAEYYEGAEYDFLEREAYRLVDSISKEENVFSD